MTGGCGRGNESGKGGTTDVVPTEAGLCFQTSAGLH